MLGDSTAGRGTYISSQSTDTECGRGVLPCHTALRRAAITGAELIRVYYSSLVYYSPSANARLERRPWCLALIASQAQHCFSVLICCRHRPGRTGIFPSLVGKLVAGPGCSLQCLFLVSGGALCDFLAQRPASGNRNGRKEEQTFDKMWDCKEMYFIRQTCSLPS